MSQEDGPVAVSPAPATATPLLELRNISKRYGNRSALDGVSFAINHAETVGLLGDNGAGKSTVIKAMCGVVQPDEGELLWEGEAVRFGSRQDSQQLGIEPIYQDGALCDSMPIWRNVFLGRERTLRFGLIRSRSMRETAAEVLHSVVEIGSHVHPDQLVGELSGGQRQAVAIARAVHFKRALLLLDEPTSALGVRETEALLAYVKRLKEEGVSSALVTHNLYHAYQVCDRFVVMSHGQVRADVSRDEITLEELTQHVIAV
ncbi:MAG TPA: ATP-binding cassette domain-containing protein [Solirubrobacteraceae bacterium]|jgi:simple sugar transport system ATP-binding protein|nr:ATP-binding cassette domain-containing protein [Solirubrobacteraceae bacterium]